MSQAVSESTYDEKKQSIDSSPSLSSSDPDSSSSSNGNSDHSSYLKYGVLRELALKQIYMEDKRVDEASTPFTWSNMDASTFDVRQGPNYKKTGKKAPSGSALYKVFAVDAYKSPMKINKISQFVDLRDRINEHLTSDANTKNKDLFSLLPPVLIVNFMIPNYSPPMFMGADPTDGEGFSLTTYAELSPESLDYLIKFSQGELSFDELPAGVKLLSKFIRAADTRDTGGKNGNGVKDAKTGKKEKKERKKHKNKKNKNVFEENKSENDFDLSQNEIDSLLSKFKCIVRVMNYSKTQLSGSMKPVIKQYNGKPFIARTSSSFYYEAGRYFAIDVDAHIFGKFARKSLGMVRKQMATVIFDGAFVIEGQEDNELPEQLLCSTRVSKIGPNNAKEFPQELLEQYTARKEKGLHTFHKYDLNSATFESC